MKAPSVVLVLTLLGGCADGVARTPAARHAADDPRSPAALYAQGLDWARRGDMVRAEQYMALAVRAGYPAEHALVAIVDACLAASHVRAALNYAEPYLRRTPTAWRVRLLAAAIHAALGHDSRARDELRRVIARAPQAAEADYLLAVLLDRSFDDEGGTRAAFLAYLDRAPDGEHAPEALAWLEEHAPAEPGEAP